MKDADCVRFLQWLLPQLRMRWPGFRKVRRQVCKRIDQRLAALGLPNVDAYRNWVAAHPEELRILDDCCQITISRFYRDRGVFDRLRDSILRELALAAQATNRHELRCWSAACASGEEPYTVNILWNAVVRSRLPGMTCKILATDCNAQMLQRAQAGRFPPSSLKDLPHQLVKTCFICQHDQYEIRPEYRLGIEWRRQDLREEMPDDVFDLILCRHLPFTYFDQALQLDILRRLLTRLRCGGVLVTGKQEALPSAVPDLVDIEHNLGLYRRRKS